MASVTIHGFEFFTGDIPQATVDKLLIQAIELRCYSKDQEKSKELAEKFHKVYDQEWRFRAPSTGEKEYDTCDALMELFNLTREEVKKRIQAKAKEKNVDSKAIWAVYRKDPRVAKLLAEHQDLVEAEDLDL